ncbi:polyphosphatidylinositol phosphatase [Citrus sinensis]|nr:polyphosphatidylinositol phosphatase [Citrus sinensis]
MIFESVGPLKGSLGMRACGGCRRFLFFLPLVFFLPYLLSVLELHEKSVVEDLPRKNRQKFDHLILGPAAGQRLPNRLQCQGLKALNKTSFQASSIGNSISFVTVFTIYNTSLDVHVDSRASNMVTVGNASYSKTERNNKDQPLNSGFIAVRGTPDGISRAKIFLEEVLRVYSSKYMNASRMLGDQLALAWVVKSHPSFDARRFTKAQPFVEDIIGASVLFLPCATYNWTPPEGAGQFHGMPLDVKKSLCLSLALFAFFISSSHALKFNVGGKHGWVTNPGENYNKWSGRNRFLVNDTLFFKYKKGSDSVLLVNKDDYDSCNTKKPLLKLDSGDSEFKLDRSGPFYFISGNHDHCQKGQKLIVVVLHERPPPPSTGPPTTKPPPHAPSPKSPSPATQPPATSPSTSPTSHAPSANPPKGSSPTPATSPSTSSPYPPKGYSPVPATSPSTSPSSHAPSPYPPKGYSPVPATSPSTSPSSSQSPAANAPTGLSPAPGTSPSTSPSSQPPAANAPTGLSPAPGTSPSTSPSSQPPAANAPTGVSPPPGTSPSTSPPAVPSSPGNAPSLAPSNSSNPAGGTPPPSPSGSQTSGSQTSSAVSTPLSLGLLGVSLVLGLVSGIIFVGV